MSLVIRPKMVERSEEVGAATTLPASMAAERAAEVRIANVLSKECRGEKDWRWWWMMLPLRRSQILICGSVLGVCTVLYS